MSDEDEIPRMEVIEGVGAAYLEWTRKTILDLLSRVRLLEAEIKETRA